MSPPSLAELTDLPHELLTQIINPLDNESIYALAKTCKILHFLALPFFLSRNGIRIRAQLSDFVSISDPSEEGLSALRTSLSARNLRNVQFYSTADVDRLFSDVCALQRLLARLPSIYSLSLVFNYKVDSALLNFGKHDMHKWSTHFSALLDVALQKSCQDLFLSGHDDLFSLQERRAPKSWNILPGTARRTVLSIFPKIKKRPEPPHPPSASRLSSFYIKSSMLLHPQLFCWTQSTLQANTGTMRQLRFYKVNISSSIWHQLLPTLILPSLYQFELTSSDQLVEGTGVALQDIEAFLRRNPSIQTLNLSGIIIPNPTPQLREPILSNLYAIEANPKIIVWILCHKNACFQKIKVVTLTPQSGEFNYDQFDEVFEALALHSQMDALRLGLNFIPKSGSHKWMEKHVSNPMPPSGAIGCIANRVTVLTIKTNYLMRLDNRDEPMVRVLPQFLALFLSLEKVNFGEQQFSGEVYLKGCKDLFKKVVPLCPSLQTVSVNGTVIDLASLGVVLDYLSPSPEPIQLGVRWPRYHSRAIMDTLKCPSQHFLFHEEPEPPRR